ncbi:hypothetical protein SXCC_04889 [Gluconacetobacter sp. SXCC-1]|nr:hypothetical protein SXCC_04889 [Gluconacetobacter sp. SXCC-1]
MFSFHEFRKFSTVSPHAGREPELRLVLRPDAPDPRLVALVRLMARRAARDWFRSQQQEQRRRSGP